MKQIYIYETDYSRSLTKVVDGIEHSHFKKIGETTNDVNERIKCQFIGVPHDPTEKLYNLLYTTEAISSYGKTISDKSIHEYLKHKGYYNIPESEWFSISLDEAVDAINHIKTEKTPSVSATGRNILHILETVNTPMDVVKLAKELNKSIPYIQCEIQKLWKNNLVSRSKKYDVQSKLVRFFYSTSDKQVYREVPNYTNLSKRDNKFLYELNMSLEEIIDIIKDCGIKEGTEKMMSTTGYTFSALEKFLSHIRKELEFQGLITYTTGVGYRNVGKIIRKVL